VSHTGQCAIFRSKIGPVLAEFLAQFLHKNRPCMAPKAALRVSIRV